MVTDKLVNNAQCLNRELDWFSKLLDTRIKLHFNRECKYKDIFEVTAPGIQPDASIYDNFLTHYSLSFAERTLLILTLIPHIKPELLDVLFTRNSDFDRGYSEFGGIRGTNHGGFLPTGETIMFILAGSNLEARFSIHRLFEADHFFSKHNILKLDLVSSDEPFLSGALKISREFLD